MLQPQKKKSPAQKIRNKIIKYLFFTIFLSWSPIALKYYICRLFALKPKEFYLYTPDICLMTVILASTNIKDLLESRISRTSTFFTAHIILNITNIVLSLIYIAVVSYIEFTSSLGSNIMKMQFRFIIIMYILAALLGSCVQIGGIVRWKK